ncbi:unnamed protein product [Rhodiola kirilowii]
MSSQKLVTVKDLVEEGKKRGVFLAICVVGLSYIMSLTSSSVLVNLPAALLLVVILRYFSLDFEMRRKAIIYKSRQPLASTNSSTKPPIINKVVDRSEWKRKVNSPAVENALDQFTRHLVSEWVTDLWYSRITPDKEGPEELVHIINGVFAEISFRMKNINLIDLLTRDIINLICSHLKIFRLAQAKIKMPQLGSISLENQDRELKVVLAAENKLHPALFSPDAEHKVLQHLISGLISYTFKSEDLQCAYFRYTVRELIACAVIRPVLNLASPRFINERIENIVTSRMKASKGFSEASEKSKNKAIKMSRLISDPPQDPDHSATGVELVPLKDKQPATSTQKLQKKEGAAKDPLLSVDTHSSRSWHSMPSGSFSGEVQGVQRQVSGGEWGDVLDLMSHRKSHALAPENIENMWAKGRNFKKNESGIEQVQQKSLNGAYVGKGDPIKTVPQQLKKNDKVKGTNNVQEKRTSEANSQRSSDHLIKKQVEDSMHPEETESSGTSGSWYTSEDEETNTVTGLDSPEIKVWDSKKNKNFSVDHIHHPLESFDGPGTRKSARGHASRIHSGRKRYKISSKKIPLWKEVQRTSFLSGDGQDILNSTGHDKNDLSSDEFEFENLGRLHSSLTASSTASYLSVPESQGASANHVETALLTDSFLRLRCEVTAANIVRSDSGTFAVYSISVTDVNNHSWSIKRRFKHFEQLHRRLKEYPQYNLHLPPKHFLSTGSDMSVIQERSQLLDKYLKKLMQLPTVSGAVEVWDFLSVDSQTYTFSNSFSIIDTLPVSLDSSSSYGGKKVADCGGSITAASAKSRDPRVQRKDNSLSHNYKVNANQPGYPHVLGSGKDSESKYEGLDGDSEIMDPNKSSAKNLATNAQKRNKDGLEEESQLSPDAADQALPAEWVPSNVSVPLLDLVDVILQIEDGGWIRRKAFWVAKQLLHLGMGDALDDWLLEKIQRLRQGSLVASGIGLVEQILWPDGIFITKHPKRQRPPNGIPPMSPSDGRPPVQSSPRKEEQDFEEQQRQEADRRARLVYELMIDKAPAAIVGVIGRKEYEHCAKDLYFFIQSAVCLKQLAFELVELLFVSAFPELDQTIKELHQQKHMFGKLQVN